MTTTLNIRGIDPDIYRKFKALAAIEGKSFKEKLIEVLKKEVEKEEGVYGYDAPAKMVKGMSVILDPSKLKKIKKKPGRKG